MEDQALRIANLQVRISMLRREEQRWLSVLADDSQSNSGHNKAPLELRKVMSEIIAANTEIKKLTNQR